MTREAAVMLPTERVKAIARRAIGPYVGGWEDRVNQVAHDINAALQAYGDERAREARAAAIEEAAQEMLARFGNAYMGQQLAKAIRALAASPPPVAKAVGALL